MQDVQAEQGEQAPVRKEQHKTEPVEQGYTGKGKGTSRTKAPEESAQEQENREAEVVKKKKQVHTRRLWADMEEDDDDPEGSDYKDKVEHNPKTGHEYVEEPSSEQKKQEEEARDVQAEVQVRKKRDEGSED